MADLRSICGDYLDNAERENRNAPWIKFSARTYERECADAVDEAVADYEADHHHPDIPEVWRTYRAWQGAELRSERLLDLDIAFSTLREVIDAKYEADKLWRIANLAHTAWEANHGCLGEGTNWRSPTVHVRRVKTAPAKFVRVNGVKIPRSKSHVPC